MVQPNTKARERLNTLVLWYNKNVRRSNEAIVRNVLRASPVPAEQQGDGGECIRSHLRSPELRGSAVLLGNGGSGHLRPGWADHGPLALLLLRDHRVGPVHEDRLEADRPLLSGRVQVVGFGGYCRT